ncbi:MAG: cupredoxin domain-containing protein [Nanoarchaeota archaeon]|nr:cupredoxin domain-containing protein [Nanoarchaeota archaeon]
MKDIEIHISKNAFERMIFIGIIIILIIISVFAVKKEVPECPEPDEVLAVEEPVVKQQEEKKTIIEEEENIFYVDLKGVRFNPRKITIPKNSTVIWTNKEDHTAHKVYESKRLFISQRMEPGDTFNFTFAALGTYTYYDAIFTEAMKGTIVVTE